MRILCPLQREQVFVSVPQGAEHICSGDASASLYLDAS